VQIIDNEGSMMFPLGSAEPTEKAKEILRLVTENISNIENRIAIEGHTDAAPFKGAQTTNWELSTARASAARRELENNGVAPGHIARVVGYADQELFVPDNPRDPRNRQISTTKGPASMLKGMITLGPPKTWIME
jgi:chemotaxis protein MotB